MEKVSPKPKGHEPKAEDKLKATLAGLSSSGRNVLDKARELAKEPAAAAPPPLRAKPPRQTAPLPAKRKKPMGRPPLPELAEQRTITFTADLLDSLENFAENFSGKRRGFRRPSLSETVRVALKMWVNHPWTKEEKREAWKRANEADGESTEESGA
jgi:uncharacterized protein (DUF4415 family)